MVDIHSHILAGLDDGAETVEESVAMVRMAAQAGTTDIVASPHANLDFRFEQQRVEAKIAELAEAAGPVPRIHYGCDFHLAYDNIRDALENPARYTINHKSYLLVEFSDLLIFKNTEEIFDHLLGAGMIPIVTHPERNWLLQNRVARLEEWVGKGVLLQVTAQSLLGRFGRSARDFSEALLKKDLVHIVASDAHDCDDRPPRLDEARRQVARKYGEARADRLFTANPTAVIRGESIEAYEEEPRPKKWFRRWA